VSSAPGAPTARSLRPSPLKSPNERLDPKRSPELVPTNVVRGEALRPAKDPLRTSTAPASGCSPGALGAPMATCASPAPSLPAARATDQPKREDAGSAVP